MQFEGHLVAYDERTSDNLTVLGISNMSDILTHVMGSSALIILLRSTEGRHGQQLAPRARETGNMDRGERDRCAYHHKCTEVFKRLVVTGCKAG